MNNLPGGQRENEHAEYREVIEQTFQLSNYLKCGIDKNVLVSMINLVEYGVPPEKVAMIVAAIRKAPKD